jgi:hypothetical protein
LIEYETSAEAEQSITATKSLGQSLSLRPDWLQQKVRPDSQWQRRMELLLKDGLIKSTEQQELAEANRVGCHWQTHNK